MPCRWIKIAKFYRFIEAKLQRAVGESFVIFGHIGDAHLHINTFSDNPEHFAAAKAVTTELARDAVSLEGTVGAEHGLGKRKAHLLEIQYLPAEIEAMRAVKGRFDPGQWILGQGTLLSPIKS